MRKSRYTSDLNDEQWDLIKALFEPLPKEGHPREISYREILNASFYVVRTGCQWRNLPKDLPPWSAVYTYYRNWVLSGFWIKLHEFLRKKLRYAKGRNLNPSAAIIDSQSVKSSQMSQTRGYDAAKKVNGRKRQFGCRYPWVAAFGYGDDGQRAGSRCGSKLPSGTLSKL